MAKGKKPDRTIKTFMDSTADDGLDSNLLDLLDAVDKKEAAAHRATERAFFEDARFGVTDRLRAHLQAGINVNAVDPRTGGTALHHVAACSGVEAFDVLRGTGKLNFLARDRLGRLAFELCSDRALSDRILEGHVDQARRDGIRLRFRP